MSEEIIIFVAISFACLFIIGMILEFISFDRLLGYQYERYRAEWEKEGEPCGSFWTPTDSGSMQRLFRRPDFLAKKWADDKPEWIWEDAKATDYYNCFRVWRRFRLIISGLIGLSTLLFIIFKIFSINK